MTFDAVGYRYDDESDPLRDGGASLRLEDVEPGGTPALDHVSFVARPGILTAIVGESGSGKSTTAALLDGSLAGYTGTITLSADDASVELGDLTAEAMSAAVTLVSSRSHLFTGTLRDNLLMANPFADDDTLWRALMMAHVDDFVRSQPEGLDMPIAPDASNLSGGQRQRIAIARALLRDCPIYIFDEATSSVDAESEALILDVIRDLARQATVIMITHRMANAVQADQVVVFDHGRVAETGTHVGLMADNGVYARLFRVQQTIEQVGHRSLPSGRGRLSPCRHPRRLRSHQSRRRLSWTLMHRAQPRRTPPRTLTLVSRTLTHRTPELRNHPADVAGIPAGRTAVAAPGASAATVPMSATTVPVPATLPTPLPAPRPVPAA